MNLLTLSNLFPRPDRPQAGMFNLHLFAEMAKIAKVAGGDWSNLCLVPEWRLSRYREIGLWTMDPPSSRGAGALGGYGGASDGLWTGETQTTDRRPQTADLQASRVGIGHQNSEPSTSRRIVEEVETQHAAPYRREGGNPERSLPSTINDQSSTDYVPVFYLPGVGRSLSWWTYGRSLQPHRKAFAWADLVYAAWLYPDGVAAARMARQAGKPYMLMVQGSDVLHLECPVRRRVIVDACDHAMAVVCVAEHLRKRLLAAGVNDQKLRVVPNGVAEEFMFRPRADAVAELQKEDCRLAGMVDGPVGLFVGNLVDEKDPGLALRAFVECRTRVGRGHFVMIGEGHLYRRLVDMAASSRVSVHVSLLGRRSHAEVARWMNVVDYLCLTSSREGMPNVVAEALASGLPVVTVDVGACREMLHNEEGARVATERSVESVTAALDDLLHVRHDRAAMAAQHTGRRWKIVAGEILGLRGGC